MSKPYQPNDRFAREARVRGYRARSAFKLREIQDRFGLVRKGDRVLDLGAAPGSFMQVVLELIGEKGGVIGLDIQEIKPFKQKNAQTYVCDIFDEARVAECLGDRVSDVITSDLAPSTSGIKSMDAGRSLRLSRRVLDIAHRYLKTGGNLLLKSLSGIDEGELMGEMKKQYKTVKKFRPQAIRSSSGEFYLVGIGKI